MISLHVPENGEDFAADPFAAERVSSYAFRLAERYGIADIRDRETVDQGASTNGE